MVYTVWSEKSQNPIDMPWELEAFLSVSVKFFNLLPNLLQCVVSNQPLDSQSCYMYVKYMYVNFREMDRNIYKLLDYTLYRERIFLKWNQKTKAVWLGAL